MRLATFPKSMLAALALISVAACGSDKNDAGTGTALKAVATSLSAPLRGKSGSASEGIGMTRATLANIVTPVDLVTVESSGAQGVIAKIGTNRGVETWSSIDGKTLSLRDGVLVATRGLGADLMSALVPTRAQLLQTGTSHPRAHTILDGEDKPVTLRFDCRSTRFGTESIVVVERAYQVYRIEERCSGEAGAFSNDYWFEIGGKLRRSRQMVSDSVGFVVIEHLQ